jgi:hypothetical protein
MSLLCGSCDEPLQDGIQVRLFFGAYAIAGDLAMGHALQVQRVDQLVYREMATKVGLIAQDQERDTLHGWFLKENVELLLRYWQSLLVGGVDDESGML